MFNALKSLNDDVDIFLTKLRMTCLENQRKLWSQLVMGKYYSLPVRQRKDILAMANIRMYEISQKMPNLWPNFKGQTMSCSHGQGHCGHAGCNVHDSLCWKENTTDDDHKYFFPSVNIFFVTAFLRGSGVLS